jgi:hypothetical protein
MRAEMAQALAHMWVWVLRVLGLGLGLGVAVVAGVAGVACDVRPLTESATAVSVLYASAESGYVLVGCARRRGMATAQRCPALCSPPPLTFPTCLPSEYP